MARKIDIYLTMVKYAFIVSMMCTFYFGTVILVNYYQEHNDFKFKERIDYIAFTQDQIPEEVMIKANNLLLFQRITVVTIGLYFILEFLKYKKKPEGHFFNTINNWLKKQEDIK